MPRYIVTIPITGYASVEVEAASAKTAEDAAWEALEDDATAEEVRQNVEWEFTPHVTTGNVCHARLNDIEVELVKEPVR